MHTNIPNHSNVLIHQTLLIFMEPCIVDDSVEIPTRCSFVIEFIIPKFIEGSTCFERHTAHYQELQTVFAASSLYTQARGCKYSLEFLMMSGVPPETCRAFNKLWNNKFYYKAASCWCFYWDIKPYTFRDSLAHHQGVHSYIRELFNLHIIISSM